MSNYYERFQLDAPTFAALLADKSKYEITVRYPTSRATVRRRTQPRRRTSIGFDYDPHGALLGHEVRVDGVQHTALAEGLDLAGLDTIMSYSGEPPTIAERVEDAESAIDTLDGRVDDLEADVVDHEARIVDLETP